MMNMEIGNKQRLKWLQSTKLQKDHLALKVTFISTFMTVSPKISHAKLQWVHAWAACEWTLELRVSPLSLVPTCAINISLRRSHISVTCEMSTRK